MKGFKKIYSFLILLGISVSLHAQQSDSLIFKAMKDEMNRSMEMRSKDYDTPAFIGYTYVMQSAYRVYAQQGALMENQSKKFADATWRLTIGDYELNDENFQNRKSNGAAPDLLYEVSRPPIYPDYKGLRNSLWTMTNYSYNVAAPNQKSKKELIQKYNLRDNEELLDDFSKEDVVELFKHRVPYAVNQDILKNKVRKYSAAFKQYENLKFSEASINITQNDVYYLNTEGTKYRVPYDLTNLSITVKSKFSEDKSDSRALSIIASKPEDLPSDETVLEEIQKLADNLEKSSRAQKMIDDYTGPVLIIGNVVGKVLLNSLFSFDNSLNARRQDLIFEDYNKIYFEEISNKLQYKLGEKVLPENISIKAYPHLESFMGKKLIGNFSIDSEGVIPSDSLIMVENGVLKNLFSSRVPTNVSDTSTGYRRFTFNGNNMRVRSAPGILKFESHSGYSIDELKKELIKLAKQNNEEFAYIIRTIPSEVAMMPDFCYRINVNTGDEELIDQASFRYKIDAQELKKLKVANQVLLHDFLWGTQRFYLNSVNTSGHGLPISLIVPSAILVESADIRSISKTDNLDVSAETISNPFDRKP